MPRTDRQRDLDSIDKPHPRAVIRHTGSHANAEQPALRTSGCRPRSDPVRLRWLASTDVFHRPADRRRQKEDIMQGYVARK
jgi:hypothetical protein